MGQFLLVLRECFRQQVIGFGGCYLQHLLRLSEHVIVVMHHQITFGNGVKMLVVVQHEKSSHQHLYGYAGFQKESLVADQFNFWCQLMKPLQQAFGIVLLAHQYGKILRGQAFLHQVADVVYHIRNHALLVILWGRVAALGVEGYRGITFFFCMAGKLLYIAIDILYFKACVRLKVIKYLGCLGEERIIEVDYVFLAAEVIAQFLVLR